MFPNFSPSRVTLIADSHPRLDRPGNDNQATLVPGGASEPGSVEWRVISILATFSQIEDVNTRRRVVDLLQSIEG